MKDLSVISIQDGVLLGLRFRFDQQLAVTGIIGSESLDEPGMNLVQSVMESDLVEQLPSSELLLPEEIKRERTIHMLDGVGWTSEQTGNILLHQNRLDLRCNMVSPLAALAALQLHVGSGITYLSKQREIFLNHGSIELRSASPDTFSSEGLSSGYVCGPDAAHVVRSMGSAKPMSTANQMDGAKLLSFAAMHVELGNALRSELIGLGHLFALTVGAALHLVKPAAPHTRQNS